MTNIRMYGKYYAFGRQLLFALSFASVMSAFVPLSGCLDDGSETETETAPEASTVEPAAKASKKKVIDCYKGLFGGSSIVSEPEFHSIAGTSPFWRGMIAVPGPLVRLGAEPIQENWISDERARETCDSGADWGINWFPQVFARGSHPVGSLKRGKCRCIKNPPPGKKGPGSVIALREAEVKGKQNTDALCLEAQKEACDKCPAETDRTEYAGCDHLKARASLTCKFAGECVHNDNCCSGLCSEGPGGVGAPRFCANK